MVREYHQILTEKNHARWAESRVLFPRMLELDNVPRKIDVGPMILRCLGNYSYYQFQKYSARLVIFKCSGVFTKLQSLVEPSDV